MTNVDQFESVFLSAIKDPFRYQQTRFNKVLLVTDLDISGAEVLLRKTRHFTARLDHENLVWHLLSGDRFRTTEQLLQLVEQKSPDLIVTHRNLHSEAWRVPHSLGEHLDMLAQKTQVPVLVLPHPRHEGGEVHSLDKSERVMAVTDHLTDDHRLINHAAAFTSKGGQLYLVHIEDQAVFDRMIAAISRIPSIDTEEVRTKLARQLLKEPHDYVSSCRQVLEEAGLPLKVEEKVEFGNHLKVYRDYAKTHAIDLLVMNTKDEDQLAMHGLAYPLAVELRDTPLLML